MDNTNNTTNTLTVAAVSPRLAWAMQRAGISTPVTLEPHSDLTDPWADRWGFKVVCGCPQTRARAVRWLCLALEPDVKRKRAASKDRRASYGLEADEARGVVLHSRYAISD